MDASSTTTLEPRQTQRGRGGPPRDLPPKNGDGDRDLPPSGGGFFSQYKPEQGKATRLGTVIVAGALAAWGSFFLYERLQVYEDADKAWMLLITPGIPILFAVIMGALIWWVAFVNRKSSDFMIATEGEMKKVNWSSRREVIGSTKVVIFFALAMAIYLFVVDIVFQAIFQWMGVLKLAAK